LNWKPLQRFFVDDGTDWDFLVTASYSVDFARVTGTFGVFDFARAFVDSRLEDLVRLGLPRVDFSAALVEEFTRVGQLRELGSFGQTWGGESWGIERG
jgi:hypothetical protein